MLELSYTHQISVEAPVEEVFEFCSDLRNELIWNPRAEYVVKATDGPVGLGTRFLARWANVGSVGVEVIEFDPPHGWGTYSCASGLDVYVRGRVTHEGSRTLYTVSVEVQPVGVGHMYAPLALLAMRRQDVTNMRLIRDALEKKVALSV